MVGSERKNLPSSAMIRKPGLFLYGFLFLLFLAYRSFYWRNSLPEEWDQVILNVIADTLMVYTLRRIIEKVKISGVNRLLFLFAWLVLAIAGSLVLIGLHYGVYVLTGNWQEPFVSTFRMPTFQVFDALVVVMIGLSLSTAFSLYDDWNKARLEVEKLEKDNILSEINYLKSQLNPHFVFNTLNSIYFLINDTNDQARDALHKFSEMLRYQLYESNAEDVSIEDEIKYLQNYVALQKLRLEETYDIRLEIDKGLHAFRIAPLLMIIPVENAFKYISHDLEKNFVHIRLSRENGILRFNVRNSRDADPDKSKPGGIGLENLKRRLELLYLRKSTLNVVNKEDSFEVDIQLEV